MAPQKLYFRNIIRKLHLWLGLTSGLVVFLISISGCLYAFKDEIFGWVHYDQLHYQESSGRLAPLDSLKARAAAVLGDSATVQWMKGYHDNNRSWSFSTYQTNPEAVSYFGYIKDYRTVYLNPYTGAVTGIIEHETEFFNLVKMFHWSLWLRTEYGQPIVGWCTVVFIAMLLTGVFLWWPRHRKAVKQRFTVKWKARWRRVNYDLHNVLGFYVLFVVLILALSGMVWAFDWFKSSVYQVVEGEKELPVEKKKRSVSDSSVAVLPLENMRRQVQKVYPEAYGFRLVPAADSVAPAKVTVYHQQGVLYDHADMQFDQYSSEVLANKAYNDHNEGELLLDANFDIHTGAILGLPGKILVFLGGLVAASLPFTGFIIWWGRVNKQRKRQKAQRF